MLRQIEIINDAFVYQDDKTHWPWAMMDGFRDYGYFFSGDLGRLNRCYQQAKSLNCNGRRVFMAVDSFAKINPRTTPGYYDKVGPFLDYLEAYGLYAELTHGDLQLLMPDAGAQYDHLMKLMAAIGDRPCFLEGCNEGDKNGASYPEIVQALIQAPKNILTSIASGLGGGTIPLYQGKYYGRYGGQHTTRSLGMAFFGDCCPIYMQNGGPHPDGYYPGVGFIPVVDNEPIGFAEYSAPGRRSNDTNLAYKLARTLSCWNNGTLHLDSYGDDVLVGMELACAQAWYAGIF